MVGTFPDVPGPRIAYDLNNSIVNGCMADGTLLTTFTAADKTAVNDEDGADSVSYANSGNGALTAFLNVVFPERYNLVGYLICNNAGTTNGIDISTDTTDGLNGTWTASGATHTRIGPPSQDLMRTSIQTVAINDIKGIRFKHAGSAPQVLYAMALYGAPTAAALTAAPDRLRLWHPTSDAEVGGAHFDFGDLKLGQTAAKTFRIRNNSATLTASAISVVLEVLSELSPATLSEYSFSLDGTTWTTSISPPNLAPGATSGVLHVRRVVGTSALYSAHQARISATATFA